MATKDRESIELEIVNINIKAGIVYGLILIIFLLMYIAFFK